MPRPPLPAAARIVLLALLLMPMLAGLLQDLAAQLAPALPLNGWAVLAALLLVLVAVRHLLQGCRQRRRRRQAVRAARTAFLAHADKLVLNRIRLVQADEYGIEDCVRWQAHLERFVANIVRPMLRPRQRAHFIGHEQAYVVRLLDAAIAKRQARAIDPASTPGRLSGSGFERFCLDELRKQRWTARPTPASGDQGADIVAETLGRAVVFQCKYHATPVGNKAVQEVAAARHHYRADAACVVSNQGYTRSARALAATNGVFLIHYSDLPGFREQAFAG